MELSELLLGRADCPCGMSHSCPIDYLVIEEGALKKIPELVSKYSNIVLAADTNTYAVCGKQVEDVNRLLRQYEAMNKMMKQLTGKKGKFGRMKFPF